MNPTRLVAFTLVPVSLLGYGAVLYGIRRRGGAVKAGSFGPGDLCVALALALFLACLSAIAFQTPAAAVENVSATQLWMAEGAQLVLVAGLGAYLLGRKMAVVELYGLKRYGPLRLGVYALGLVLLAIPAVALVTELVSSHLPQKIVEEQQTVLLFRRLLAEHQYGGIVSIVVTAALLAPVMEEFVFRGFLYPIFKRYLGGIASALITASLFAALHANVQALPGLCLLALCLTAAYERSGSLLLPICMHATFNSLNLLYLALAGSAATP